MGEEGEPGRALSHLLFVGENQLQIVILLVVIHVIRVVLSLLLKKSVCVLSGVQGGIALGTGRSLPKQQK